MLKRDHEASKTQLQRSESEAHRYREANGQLKEEMAIQRERLENAERDAEQAADKLRELEAAAQEHRHTIAIQESRLSDRDSQLADIRQSLDATTRELRDVEQRLAE